jgi:glycosyltransferase involved in cell wall biosynthesis
LASDDRPSALVLSPESPYPIAGGGALRTASLLHHLARSYDVDLIVFSETARNGVPKLPPGLVRRVYTVDLPTHSRSPLARAWRNASRLARDTPPLIDRFAGFERAIDAALAGKQYMIGLVEHLWCAPYGDQLARSCARTILDLHNIESVLHARCSRVETGAAGFAHRVFRGASLEFEREWLPRYSQVLAPSHEDAAAARAIAPRARVVVYPNAIPSAPVPPRGDDNAIVFSGNLEYHPNRLAVRYFRDEVWPLVHSRWPGLKWRLIGKNPEAVRDLTAGDPSIELQGPVIDAVAELARARIAVAPIQAGSGTRLKILEAWAAGVPVVSTQIGAEGLGAIDGNHILIADSATTMVEAISRLLASPELRSRIGQAGRMLLQQEFTWESAWAKLDF